MNRSGLTAVATSVFDEEASTRRQVLACGGMAAATLASLHFGKSMMSRADAAARPAQGSATIQMDVPAATPVPYSRDVSIAPASVLPIPSQRAECFMRGDGAVLAGANYDKPIVPASQTKTVFAPGFFEALLAGRLQPDDVLTFKARHLAQHEVNGPKFRFQAGDTLTVRQAGLLAFNHSHNAATTLMAEAGFDGDLQAALAYANAWALQCWKDHGYEDRDFQSRFLTAHGLTRRDGNGAGADDLPLSQQNRTTVLELLTFSRVIASNYRDIGEDYFGVKVFDFHVPRGGVAKVYNSNRLLEGNPRPVNAGAEPVRGVVGGKTGLTDLSGASLQFHYESPGTGAEFFGMYTGAQGPGRVVGAAQQARRVLMEGLRADVNRQPPQLLAVSSDKAVPPMRVATLVPSV